MRLGSARGCKKKETSARMGESDVPAQTRFLAGIYIFRFARVFSGNAHRIIRFDLASNLEAWRVRPDYRNRTVQVRPSEVTMAQSDSPRRSILTSRNYPPSLSGPAYGPNSTFRGTVPIRTHAARPARLVRMNKSRSSSGSAESPP